MQPRIVAILLLLAGWLLSGCSSKPPTEAERYQKITGSFTYKSYSTLSQGLVNPAIKQGQRLFSDATLSEELAVNADTGLINIPVAEEAKPDTGITLAPLLATTEPVPAKSVTDQLIYTHSFLALMHSLAQSPTLAMAEADLAFAAATQELPAPTPLSLLLTHKVRSYALHANSLHDMAYDSSVLAQSGPYADNYQRGLETADVYIKLMLGIMAVLNDDPESAEILFQGLAEKADTPWLPRLVRMSTLVIQHPLTAGPRIVAMLNDPQLSDAERRELAKLRLLAENSALTAQQRKQEVGSLVKQWTLSGLSTAAKVTGEVLASGAKELLGSLILILAAK